MKRLLILAVALLTAACTSQEAHLIYLPEQTSAPAVRVTPTPSPAPEPIYFAPIEGEGFSTDPNGLPILDPQTHYYDYYLSVSNLRVYEHNGETLIDATITNTFQKTLIGGLRISFYDDNGMMYGYADFYTAGGSLKLFSGENRVYADVLTEVDVQTMDFELTVTDAFKPEN